MANPEIDDYNQYLNETPGAHDGGEFWSAVLWDLRNNIGSYRTDELVSDALGYLSSNPTFIEYHDALLDADDYNYSGTHNIEIMDTFAARGIGQPAPPISVYMNGPGHISSYGSKEYTANTLWEDGAVSYQWRVQWEGSSTWETLGTSSTQTVYVYNDDIDFVIRVDVQDSENSDYASKSVNVTL